MMRQQGMTLVEVLVALVLLSMLSVGLFASFRYGQRAYMQLAGTDARARDVLTAQRFLRGVIESAYPFANSSELRRFGLEGTESELHITALAPGYSQSGLYRYHIYTKPREDGLRDIMVTYGVDRHGTATDNYSGSKTTEGELLLNGVDNMEFAYLPPTDRSGNGSQRTAIWQESWKGKISNPVLVRMLVNLPKGDRRRWPELIVAPHVTDDAACEFDVILQDCRGR